MGSCSGSIWSNLRWCSNGFEFTCWNGEIVAWGGVAGISGSDISGSDIRGMMIEAVEKRFGSFRAPAPIEWLADNGSRYTAPSNPMLCDPAQSGTLLRAGGQPREQQHLQGLHHNRGFHRLRVRFENYGWAFLRMRLSPMATRIMACETPVRFS